MRDFLAATGKAVRSPRSSNIRGMLQQFTRVVRAPYHAAPLAAWVGPAWTIFLIVSATQRGADLLNAPDGRGEISAWVNVVGNTGYGVILLVLAFVLSLALLTRRVLWLVLAHAAGVGVYVMYGTALLQGALSGPGVHGWRYGAGMLLIAVLHAGRLLALRDEIQGTPE